MPLFDVAVGVLDSPQVLDIDIFIIRRSQTTFKFVQKLVFSSIAEH